MLLHHIFEGQAHLHPDRVAIEFQETRITYGDLDISANQLAAYIKHVQQLKSGIIAVGLEKGPLVVTAVLAILKAGLAWMPLPLDAPPSRIQKIMDISSPELVLCSQKTMHISRGQCRSIVIDEPETKESIQQQPIAGLSATDNGTGPAGLCHILFTSGSTGVPKGVMLGHQAVVHNVQILADRFGLNEHTRTLQFATYTFDIFGLDLFMTFHGGGCLIMGTLEDMMSDLTAFINHARINYAQLTPTIISLINAAQAPSLRVLASSGESLTADILHQWADRVRLINCYGPTETIVCTMQDMSASRPAEPYVIGTALPNLEVLLIREGHADEVPPGTIGEICVAGVQLFTGYIGVNDSVSQQFFYRGSQKFYRTGDLGLITQLADSSPAIRLLGRLDGQVKLHGVRIDLGDVEAALGSYPGTQQCSAFVPKAGPALGGLAAVLSIRDIGPCSHVSTGIEGIDVLSPTQEMQKAVLTSLVDWVRSSLPPQAVPSTWWIVNKFPLTASGKLDRIRVQGWLEGVSESNFAQLMQSWAIKDKDNLKANEEHSALEQQLIGICSRISGLRPAAVDPLVSLLQLGFDSLAIFRMVSMARQEGLNLTVEQVLRQCSIRQLSSSLLEITSSLITTSNVEIEPFSLASFDGSLEALKAFIAEQCHVDLEDILDVYPCTPLQAGMMALSTRRHDAYVCDMSFLVSPDVNIDRFMNAWESVLSKTSILRNRIVHSIQGTELLQVTVRHREIYWRDNTFNGPMSLGDSLCRGRVVMDETSQRWRFVLKLHHALFDGWAKNLILLEIKNTYNQNLLLERVSISAPSFTSYIKYVVEDIKNHEVEHISFWKDRLKNCMVTDFPRTPDGWTGEFSTVHHVFTSAITADVSGTARKHQVTATTVVQVAWAIVLGSYVGADDVVFGSTLSGRNAAVEDIGSIIGPTMVTVPCRIRWDNTIAVCELLHQVHQESIDLIPHQHYGLQNIGRFRQGAKNDFLFRSLFLVQPESDILEETAILQEEEQRSSDTLRTYPITIELMLSGSQRALVKIHYDETVVSKKNLVRMLHHLESSLNAIGSANPDTRVCDIEIFGEGEREQIMRSQCSYPEKINRCLHDLVQETAKKYPGYMAVRQHSPPQTLSYKELDQSSTSLARYLQNVHNIRPGDIVPLGFEKSALAITAMLAILKTGAAYVALDPSQPAPHLQRMIAPFKPKHVLCSRRTYPKIQQLVEQALEISDDWLSDGSPSIVALSELKDHASPSETAVVFFTSGSTGQPKCIASRHSAISTSMYHLTQFFRIEPGARVFQSTSFTFDMSLKDIYCTLLSGACICLPSDNDRLSPVHMRQMNVSVAFLTPSIAESIAPEDVPSLRILNVGGERATGPLIRRWASKVRLINTYGPTETIASVTAADNLAENADPNEIGKAVTSQVWIVRRTSTGSLVPVATGCIGEIAISGHTVAPGYLNDAARTAECFVEPPNWMQQAVPGSTSYLYLTGDLASKEEDGRIRIVGRRDAQVKINGIRIEPAEAEHALQRLGGMFTSAIIDTAHRPTTVKSSQSPIVLVAFIPLQSSDVHELGLNSTSSQSLIIHPDAVPEKFNLECRSAQRELAQNAPGYLIPRVFIPVRIIPLTVSGKTDRKRLRVALNNDAHRNRYMAVKSTLPVTQSPLHHQVPHSKQELRVSRIWQETLGTRRKFATSDNFFKVGGDSLVAIRLVLGFRKQGLAITVAQVYEKPTLGQMAATVVESTICRLESSSEPPTPFSLLPNHISQEIVAEAAEICGLAVHHIEDVYPVSPFQEGLAAINLHDRSAYMARWVYSVPNGINMEQLKHALEMVIARNQIFRTTLAHTSEGTVQIVLKMAEWIRQQQSVQDQLKEQLRLEGNTRLFRYRSYVSQGAESKVYLQFDVHHILYDEWTMQFFLDDLIYNYSHPGIERPGRLSYASFIRQLLSMQGNDEASTSFWKLDLEGAEELRFPCTPSSGRRFQTDSAIYSSNVFSLQRGDSGSEESPVVTSATVAAASLAMLLSSYSATEDVIFGLTLSGRHLVGLEDVAGPTISTVPFRMQVKSRQNTSVFLTDVRSKMHVIQDHQHVSLQKLSKLDIRGAREACAFRTLLVVQQAARTKSFSGSQALHLTSVEEETFISLNYGMVVILSNEESTGLARFRIEFDSSCLDEQQAHEVLSRLDRISGLLSHRDGEFDLIDVIGEHGNVNSVMMSHSYPETLGPSNKSTEEPAKHAEQTPDQIKLRDLWAKVMNVSSESIGTDDDINSLGGDSITLIRLLSAARKSGISLTIGDKVNQFTTLRDMASAIAVSQETQENNIASVSVPEPFSLITGMSKEACIRDTASKCGVNPKSVVDVYPCTPLQEGLMAVSSTELGSYFVQHCYRILGNVDHDRLESALRRVWQAENVLRTRIFINSNLQTVQVVLDDNLLPFGIYRQYPNLREYLESDRQKQFQYCRPLTRFALVINGRGQSFLVISQHHAVSDGWTTRLLEDAIKRQYAQSGESGKTIGKSHIPAFIKYVHEVQESEDAAHFWKTTLAGARVTEFPLAREDRTFRTTDWIVGSCDIPSQSRVPLPALLEAAWGLVLRNYVGSDDVCFGVVRSGRITPIQEIEKMMSPTIATIPRRLILQATLQTSQYLDEVFRLATMAAPFEQYGLSNIRLLGQAARNACDFRTLLVVQPKQDLSEQEMAHGQLGLQSIDDEFMLEENYGLAIECQPHANGTLSIYMNYDKTGTSDVEAIRISKHFIQAISKLGEKSEGMVGDIDIFDIHDLEPVISKDSGIQDRLSELAESKANGNRQEPSNAAIQRNAMNGVMHERSNQTERSSHEILRRLWADVLHIDSKTIHPDDDFLILGGDSISAIKLSSHAREYGISLPARSILQNSILRNMALSMGEQQAPTVPIEEDSPTPDSKREYATQISKTYGILAENIDDVYPCTPLQINLVALTLRQTNAYVSTERFRLSPSTDIDRFIKAWELVYQRHEMLRTRVCQVFDNNGHAALVQVVCASDAIPWQMQTSDLTPQQQQRQRLLPGMDLGAPLCHFSLIQTSSSGTYFQLTRHHSIYDGWSTNLLWDDFKFAYLDGSSPPSRPTFRSFVQYLQGLDRQEILGFWKRELDEFHAEHYPALPVGRSLSGAGNASVGITAKFYNSHEDSTKVLSFPHLARAAWALVLATVGRWPSTNHDICFGSVVSGRMEPVAGIEHIAGPTLSTVPVRIKVDMNEPVVCYLQRVRQSAIAMAGVEHIGLNNISQVSHGSRAACQFRNILVVQPRQAIAVNIRDELDGICEAVRSPAMQQPYGVVMECTQHADGRGFRLDLSFDQALLTESEVRIVLEIFSNIMTLLDDSSRGDTLLGDLLRDLAKIGDYKRMVLFNGPPLPRSTLCLHELFQRSALLSPHRIAVLAHDQELTYETLHESSSRLATYLRLTFGVSSNSLIPMCFEKSGFMVIAMLAILRAGGAYVPLDPSHPPARLREMIDQCKSKLILVSDAQKSKIAPSASVPTLVVNSSLLNLCQANPTVSTEPQQNVGPRDVAYTIFTSGSTGKPKGVVMEHGSAALSMMQYADVFQYPSEKGFKVLQFSSYTFDVSVAEIFATLAFGGTVCIPKEEDRLNDLVGVMISMGVSMAFLTPTMVSTLQPGDVSTLEVLCMTGESPTPSLVEIWAAYPGTKLFNAYGPTEAAVHCAAGRIEHGMGSNTIGSPFGGQLWIVDPEDHTKLRPVGCIGELVISGSTLARGYLDNPEQTAKAFVDNVVWFEGVEPLRIYKTGDVARYRGDGTIEFLGRKDGRQVKFHGLRIELGEIEAAVNSSDRAGSLASITVEKLSIAGRDSLVAFFQIKTSPTPNGKAQDVLIPACNVSHKMKTFIQTICISLGELLPRYMIPSLFLPVSKWPHTTSGKTDRQLLRKLGADLSEKAVDMYRAFDCSSDDSHSQVVDDGTNSVTDDEPSTGQGVSLTNTNHKARIQAFVLSLWQKVLRRGTHFRPGSDQDFFKLGGDSVSSIFLVAEFRREQIYITVSDVYRHKTLPAMVDLVLSRQVRSEDSIQGISHASTERSNVPFSLVQLEGAQLQHLLSEVAADLSISPDSIQDIYPCTSLQEGIMFLSERVEGSYHAHLSVLMPRPLDLERLYNAFRKLVEMHDILRTRIIFHNSLGSTQIILTAAAYFREAERLGPVREAGFIRFGYGLPLHHHALTARGNRVHLELDCHHSIYDGWSLPLLVEDLRCLYYNAEYCPEYAPKPFKDLVAYMHSPSVIQAGDDFWTKYLQGAVISDFPELAGRTHDSIRATSYCEHSISLDPRQVSKGTTMATILTAAWSLVVSGYTSSNDVCFGLLLSGRDAPVAGVESIRGPAINTVPFRVVLDHHSTTVAAILDCVQSHMLDLIPNQFTSLTKLRKMFSDGYGDFGSLLSIQTGASAARDAVSDNSSYDFEICSTPAEQEGTPAIFGEPYPLFLGVTVDQSGENVVIGAQYDSTVVSGDQVARIISQYDVVIRQLAGLEFQNTRLVDVSLLSELDKQCLLDWAGKPVELGDLCVHEMIESITAARPDHQAIEGFTESLTYAQLDQRAYSLASHLLHLRNGRVRRGMVIPIWMEMSPAAVVGILAVLKLGASYVPLDHRFPIARAEYIVSEVAADIMLVSENKSDLAAELVARLEAQNKTLMVVQVDQTMKTMKMLHAPYSQAIPSHLAAKTSDLAYVIYTSGSTGQPKGVMMEHWALTATVKEQAVTYGFDSETRMFGLASLSWDPSLLEIFAILSHGGCLCIPTEAERSGCQDLVDSINRHKANQISTSPAVASLIDLRATPTVQVISLGGEMIREENIVNANQAGVRLFNIYGPSEACIDAIVHRNVVQGVSPRNIGQPMSSQVWIVDPTDPRRLVPPGCAGELALSGTLARGYLNDEIKTARSFLADLPFASPVYLTGDLGRYEADGSIYFLGRKDRQVKLNGQRVELGDIETATKTLCPQHDVVVDYFSVSGDEKKSLVVYLSLSASISSSQPRRDWRQTRPIKVESRMRPDCKEFQRLQTELRNLLPRYMVPRVFITVSSLPLSNADKIDLKLLRAAYAEWMEEWTAEQGSKQQTNMVPAKPRSLHLAQLSPGEIVLRSLWASAIGSPEDSIQTHDDIFDLGADSLTVIKLATLARTNGYNLSVAQIHASPTLSKMAKLLRSESGQNGGSVHDDKEIPPFSLLPASVCKALGDDMIRVAASNGIVDMFPCTSFQTTAVIQGQRRHKAFYAWFLVRIRGTLDLERLQAACDLLVQRHAALRTSYRLIGQCFVQQIHAPTQAISDFKQLRPCESDKAFVALLDRDVPEPVCFERVLTRFRVVPYCGNEEGGYLLSIGMSHAQYDGFCWTKMFDDLYHAYVAQTLHEKSQQPPPYSRFISHSLKTSQDLRTESFWTTLLKGATMTSLPPRIEQPQPWVGLDRKQIGILPRYNTRLGNFTFAIAVKAAWSIVLSWLSDTTEIVFGSLVFGRNPQIHGVGDMVGACINVVPNRVSFSEQGLFTIADLLDMIQQQQISIVSFESTPLPDISRYVGWPIGTRFGSVVQHQNIDEDVFTETASHDSDISNSSTTWSFAGSAAYPGLCDDVLDCWIITVPRPQDIRLYFQYSNSRMSDDCATTITQLLCDVIRSIYEDTSRLLSSIEIPDRTVSSIRTQISQAERDYSKATANEDLKVQNKKPNGTAERSDGIISLLHQLWIKVLPESFLEGQEDDADTSFFALGGNSVLAIQLAVACQQQGLSLKVQDIFNCPTKKLQAAHIRGEHDASGGTQKVQLVLEPK